MSQHKVGKSFLCSYLDKEAIIIDTQHGYEELPGTVFDIDESKSDKQKLVDVESVISECQRTKAKMLVIDNLSDIEEWALNHVIKKAHGDAWLERGIDDGKELGFGKGRRRVTQYVTGLLQKAFNAVPFVIVVAHLGPYEEGSDVPYKGIHCVCKDIRQWIPRKCDHNALLHMDEKGRRWISFNGFYMTYENSAGEKVTEFQAGSRAEQWNEKKFLIPAVDPWKELRAAYE